MNLVDAGNAFDDIILSMSTWKMHSLLVCTKCNIWYTFSGFVFCRISLVPQFVHHPRYNSGNDILSMYVIEIQPISIFGTTKPLSTRTVQEWL